MQFVSPAIIHKLVQMQQLDVILTTAVPATVTPISFNSIRQAYHEILESIVRDDLPHFYESSWECVVISCVQSVLASYPEEGSSPSCEYNWSNVCEDMLNRIRFGEHMHLYQYRSGDRFDNLTAQMELDETKEDPEDVSRPLATQILSSTAAATHVFAIEPIGPLLTMADLSTTDYQGDEDDALTEEDALRYYENRGYESD